MENSFITAAENRRSIYLLGKNRDLSAEKIEETLRRLIKCCPTAFNSQSARTVLLLGKEHEKFWTLVKETLRKIVPAEAFARTEEKINGFAGGMGTVLFFEDRATTKNLQMRFPLYSRNFPKWALQSNGMLEYMVWTALEEMGLGANLQHYNPLIDEAVRLEWQIPEEWQLLAQMPFGSVEAPAGNKSFLPLEERFKVYGAE